MAFIFIFRFAETSILFLCGHRPIDLWQIYWECLKFPWFRKLKEKSEKWWSKSNGKTSESIYIGGGTPSRLSIPEISKLLSSKDV